MDIEVIITCKTDQAVTVPDGLSELKLKKAVNGAIDKLRQKGRFDGFETWEFKQSKMKRGYAQRIVDDFNATCAHLPTITKLSVSRKHKIKLRLEENTEEEIHQAFVMASESEFLCGNSPTGWKPTFNWFFRNDENIPKVLEGNYKNKEAKVDRARKERDRNAGYGLGGLCTN